MTDSELEEAAAKLKALQRRTHEGIHELLNVLAVIRGEVDLAVERARDELEKFYEQYPDFREGP
jgi:hypothetical protein